MFSEFMEPGIPAVVFWTFVGIGIIIQGISKSGFAGGVGILTIPLMVLVMPVEKVVACLLPLLILCDFNAIFHHRKNKIWKHILEIYIPSIFGILAGSVLWWWIGHDGVELYATSLKRFVGFIAVFFAIYILAKRKAHDWVDHLRMTPHMARVLGPIAGFTSTLAHSAGPIVSLYIWAQGLGKSVFVGTTAWTFTLINLTKLPFYIGIGLIRTEELVFDAALVPLIPIGSYLGKWMHDRVSEEAFNRVIMILVFIAGIQLLANLNLVQISLDRIFRPLITGPGS